MLVYCNGGSSAVNEPGHFELRKSSSQVNGCTFPPQKVDDFFSCRPQSKHSKAMRRARRGGARAVDLPARSFDLAHPAVAPPLVDWSKLTIIS